MSFFNTKLKHNLHSAHTSAASTHAVKTMLTALITEGRFALQLLRLRLMQRAVAFQQLYLPQQQQQQQQDDDSLQLDFAVAGQAVNAVEAAGSEGDVLSEYDGMMLMGPVPKKKRSLAHTRSRMNSRFEAPQEHILTCQVCGHARFRHHLCTYCLRNAKEERRAANASANTNASATAAAAAAAPNADKTS